MLQVSAAFSYIFDIDVYQSYGSLIAEHGTVTAASAANPDCGTARQMNHFAAIDHGQCETGGLFHRMHVAWPACSPAWSTKPGCRIRDNLAGISMSQSSGPGRAEIAGR
jgi:hypothetical protein